MSDESDNDLRAAAHISARAPDLEIRRLRAEIATLKEIAVRETMKVATLRAALKLILPDYVKGWTQDQYSEEDAMQFDAYVAAAAALKETGD